MLSDTSPFDPTQVQIDHLRNTGVSHLRKLQRMWERLWSHDFVFGSSEDTDRVEAGNLLVELAILLRVPPGAAVDERWAADLVDQIESRL